MAITQNNVQNVKFLRNGSVFTPSADKTARQVALDAMEAQKNNLADGTAILGRYNEGALGSEVKTLVGFAYISGDTKTLTVFDVDGAGADVEKKINELRNEINAKLGTDFISSSNTVEANLTALSGSSSDASGVTSVNGAKAYAKDYTDAEIDKLDYTGVTTGTGVYIKNVTEVNGIVAAETASLPTVAAISEAGKPITAVSESLGEISATAGTINAEFVNIADSGSLITATTVEGALAEIASEIDAMDKTASAEDGKVVTTISETDGIVSETKANVKDLQLGGYTKDTTATGDIASSDTINAALSKLENKAAAITIDNADGSINVSTGATGTDINVNIKSGEKVIKKDGNNGIYTDIDLVKITTGLPAEIKERYQLLASDDSQIGANIDIYKDSHIVSITYDEDTQELVYTYLDVSGATQTTRIDLSELVLEAEFESGVTATDHVVHGVVDSTSESFLTVGAGGFKLAGVQDAIDDAIEALDVTDDTAVAGQYVAAIEETDGIVAVKTRANVSEAVLNNYSKGSASGAVASTDTINEAIGKIEARLDGELAALDATVSGETSDGKVNVKVTETDGKITAVDVVGTDIASDSALTAEITARKAVDGQNGDTYAANSNKEFISGATSLNDADIKLNDALKAEETRAKAAEAAAKTVVQAGSTAASSNDAVVITPSTDGTDNHTIYTVQLGTIDCGTY